MSGLAQINLPAVDGILKQLWNDPTTFLGGIAKRLLQAESDAGTAKREAARNAEAITKLQTGMAALQQPAASTQTKTFTPNDLIFPGPRRGLYGSGASRNDTPMSPWAADARMTVEWALFNLDAYRDKPLDQAMLDQITARLERIKSKRMTAVVRFRYSEVGGDVDAPINIVRGHIQQTAAAMKPYVDWLHSWQVGWASSWGEPHISAGGSTNDLVRGGDANGGHLTQIIRAMAAALPGITIANRRAIFAYKPDQSLAYPWGFLDGLPDPSRTDLAAVMAFYNDGLGGGQDGSWKYDGDGLSLTRRQAIYKAAGAYLPTMAEMMAGGMPDADVLAQLEAYLVDGLHDNYNATGIIGWQQATRDEIARRLGYRYALTKATAIVNGGQLTLTLDVRNDGWGGYYSALPLEIGVTGSDGKRVAFVVSQDVHADLPAPGKTATLSFVAPAASGELDIKLTDPSGMPVRFANDGWNAAVGANELGLSVTA